MPATYPDDATIDADFFIDPTQDGVSYNNTGSQTFFNIGGLVDHLGEVLVDIDGVEQSPNTYYLNTGNRSITFYAAPNARQLTIRRLNIPPSLIVRRSGASSFVREYTDSTSPAIDGANDEWPLPAGSSTVNKSDISVVVDGVIQAPTAFTFPSATLGTGGIDLTVPTTVDSLLIRVFNLTPEPIPDRLRTMIDRKPDKNFGSSFQLDDVKFKSQAGYEKRRLMSRRVTRAWDLSYSPVTGPLKSAIEEFYKRRFGTFESFFFDLAHIGEQGTATVRFDGDLEADQLFLLADPLQSLYTVNIRLLEVYD